VPGDRFDRSSFLKAAGVAALALPAAPALAFGRPQLQHGPMLGRNVMDVIEHRPELSTFAELLNKTNLANRLRHGGLLSSYTVFAPDNRAFNILPGNILNEILGNPQKLLRLLEHTVLPELLTLLGLLQLLGLGGLIQPLVGPELKIAKRLSKTFIDEAELIVPNLGALNGVVHIIDGVLFKGLGL
jgi:uncharacterized surface protein with fasciclin (FAS1) repeats